MGQTPKLPIDDVLDELRAALRSRSSAVLVAPPGAGKTTRVPLALLGEPWLGAKKILVLEPRRLAARAASFEGDRMNPGGICTTNVASRSPRASITVRVK